MKKLPDAYEFDHFVLDPADRALHRDGVVVETSARCLDALVLLVSDAGRLVTKDRFMDDVWRGVPVTDEALTQCIKTLRRLLGDDAGKPRFIETVPKHGYRFIAPVSSVSAAMPTGVEGPDSAPMSNERAAWRQLLVTGGAGTLGATVAGILGGVFYGSAGAAQPLGAQSGSLSVFLVLLWLTIVAALTGGAGVSFGIAVAGLARNRAWRIIGGGLGGLLVGGTAKLLGLDAFNLLLGRSPGDITGAMEGLLLGGSVGLGSWFASRRGSAGALRTGIIFTAIAGGIAGVVVHVLGGRLMGGSLDLLAAHFPGSRLGIDQLGGLFGETGFGPIARLVTASLEGALFGGCIVGSMYLVRRGSGA